MMFSTGKWMNKLVIHITVVNAKNESSCQAMHRTRMHISKQKKLSEKVTYIIPPVQMTFWKRQN